MVLLAGQVVVDRKILLLVVLALLVKDMLEAMVREVPDIQAVEVAVRERLEEMVLLQ
jgi:hypothetical protein